MDFRDDLDDTIVELIKLPYPYMGGKSTVMPVIWQRFGNVPNFIDPFFGGGSSILFRPHANYGTETVNDLNCYLSNFWRAVGAEPDKVAEYADAPVVECDLHARHLWLVTRDKFRERLRVDPDYYDAKIAGWWVWGVCCWIGSGWCDEKKYGNEVGYEIFLSGNAEIALLNQQRPHLGNAGMGVHRPSRKLPHLGDAGKGINRPSQKRPIVAHSGHEIHRSSSTDIYTYMQQIQDRFRRVRVCCGDWRRVLGDSVTIKHGTTAILLDPPYSHALRNNNLYANETDCSTEVREWAIANGDNPRLRIALCGYIDEHPMPNNWECYRWKTSGGYGSQAKGASRGKDNADKEAIWFSPHCLKPRRGMKQASFLSMEPT